MQSKDSKLMENTRQINQALMGFDAVSYWIYGIIALVVVAKAFLSL
jgi:hypothetical protein